MTELSGPIESNTSMPILRLDRASSQAAFEGLKRSMPFLKLRLDSLGLAASGERLNPTWLMPDARAAMYARPRTGIRVR